jgi:hypothetical protein
MQAVSRSSRDVPRGRSSLSPFPRASQGLASDVGGAEELRGRSEPANRAVRRSERLNLIDYGWACSAIAAAPVHLGIRQATRLTGHWEMPFDAQLIGVATRDN